MKRAQKIIILGALLGGYLTISQALMLSSPNFEPNQTIPAVFTCDDRNIPPTLIWSDAPGGIRSFAIILEDPDAPQGTWIHWVVYNIPSSARQWPAAGLSAVLGKNSWGDQSYQGPCPPDQQHRYIFNLYALDAFLQPSSEMTAEQLKAEINDHLVESATLQGTYQRSQNNEKINQ